MVERVERVEGLLRTLAPQVLTLLAGRGADFATVEDAVQEARLAAARQWPAEGMPDNPLGWLVTVARRRLVDEVRADAARRAREASVASDPTTAFALSGTQMPDGEPLASADDTLTLLMLCCHPSLSPASAIALTLRAVGGLSTGQVAAAFLVPESTMGQRISRAKQRIRSGGARFEPPTPAERPARLAAVLHVVYLMFNEGYLSDGERLGRPDLSAEAIRTARLLHAAEPRHPEVTGLLALLLLTDARRPARTDSAGRLIPLAEQDRTRWDHTAVDEGRELLLAALALGAAGPYQIQAAVAALHDEASSTETTDWPQILALYTLLERMAPGPMVTLNRAVAVSMVDGPDAGLAVLDTLDELAGHHRSHAVRAHLLERAGQRKEARAAFETAARLTNNTPERNYLTTQAARLAHGG